MLKFSLSLLLMPGVWAPGLLYLKRLTGEFLPEFGEADIPLTRSFVPRNAAEMRSAESLVLFRFPSNYQGIFP